MTSWAVIIPSKTATNLAPCIERLWMHEPQLPAEHVIVVDDGVNWDDDAIADVPRTFTVIPNERIDGKFVFSRAVNLGIRKALEMGVDGTVCCNDDALLESPGGFSLLAETCQKHPEIGVLGATTNVTGQPLQQPRGVGLRVVPHIAFICVYVPRTTIERVGMLDERYTRDYGCEDRDYCEAVARAGLRVAVMDSVYVDHGSLISTFRGDPRQPKDYRQNYALLLEKFGTLTTN